MQTKSEITISNILSAAEGLFLARQYADVTMEQIAAACDVTKGAIYYHFPSKEKLYLAMLHADLDEKRALLGEAIASRADCAERLRRLTRRFFDLPAEKRELIRLIRRDINVFEGAARDDLVRTYQASLPELVEEVIRDGIAAGELAPGDPRLLSWHFVALVEVVLADYAASVIPGAESKIEYVLNLFLNGAGNQRNGECPCP